MKTLAVLLCCMASAVSSAADAEGPELRCGALPIHQCSNPLGCA